MHKPRSSSSIERKDLENESCELQMTPMIDVTFLLLIFFMCTLKFKVLEGTMGAFLPKDVGVSSGPADPMEKMVVRIDVVEPGTPMRPESNGELRPYSQADADRDLRFQYGSDRVVRYGVGPRSGLTRDEAVEALSTLVESRPEARFSIDARDGVIQSEVVEMLDAFVAAGVQDVTFIGQRASAR